MSEKTEKTEKTTEKETKEITKEIYKPTEKASISYYKMDLKDYSKGTVEHIEVKDETSEKAFETLKKIREMEKEGV